MQGTIDGISGEPHRSQVFRLTYKGQDYQLVLLKKSLSKLDTELPILLDGIEQKLVKRGDCWFFENRHSDQHFATEIWRNLSLRYRL
ncbi:hypothetical protein D7322_08915 [Sphingobacterium puteale]|uniref:Uncharacterized protein n=1 Tax=Sphingobacterium puteale TaxID=2420510 RepID=A0A420W0V8_9SPHI|nr:hypothetical protein [Sphingobacterium puteale]RKO72200.1 hypothetical protein D7322_08915 [Sphingobacterium puteale]